MGAASPTTMSHHFKYDLEVLRGRLKPAIRYIGLLGPAKQIRILAEYLEKKGKGSWKQIQKRIYVQVGLNIGTKTPDEATSSIITGILPIHNQKPDRLL